MTIRKPANKPSNIIALPKKRGGARPNSGPKKGSGKFGEETKAVRIPLSMQQDVMHYVENKGFNLPVYAQRVPMGPMAASIDYVERTMNLNELIKHPWATFFHPVQGESMEPTVSAGDLAMIDSAAEPMHDDVVLATINGGVTLKRLQKIKGRIWLKADNPAHQPIELGEDMENYINGVMLVAIRPVSLNHIKKF